MIIPWYNLREPMGLNAPALRALRMGRLVARLEDRWGHNDRLLKPALETLAEWTQHNPQGFLLDTPRGRCVLEEQIATAVDEAAPEAVEEMR